MKTTRPTPTPEQQSALTAFAQRSGRYWKARLLRLWDTGRDENEPEGPLLRQVRNNLGPSFLVDYRLPGQHR
jgi:hypothetical protein